MMSHIGLEIAQEGECLTAGQVRSTSPQVLDTQPWRQNWFLNVMLLNTIALSSFLISATIKKPPKLRKHVT